MAPGTVVARRRGRFRAADAPAADGAAVRPQLVAEASLTEGEAWATFAPLLQDKDAAIAGATRQVRAARSDRNSNKVALFGTCAEHRQRRDSSLAARPTSPPGTPPSPPRKESKALRKRRSNCLIICVLPGAEPMLN